MHISDLLGDLLDGVFDKLTTHSDEIHGDSILILIDEALGDCFSFSLKKHNTEYLWIRKRWNKQSDTFKATNPIEQLKYIGQKMIVPTISTQSGKTQLNVADEIFIFAEQNIDLDKTLLSKDVQIDGTEYTIQIALGQRKEEYSWHLLPPEWAPLKILTNMLLGLNNNVA